MGNVVLQAHMHSSSLVFNYKSTYSLFLLAVVNANYLFRIVDVGGHGNISDSGTLQNSAFGKGLRDGTLDFPPDAAVQEQSNGGLSPLRVSR